MAIISTAPDKGLKGRVVSSSEGEHLFDRKDRYTRMPNIRSVVKIQNGSCGTCNMSGAYITSGQVGIVGQDLLDLKNGASFYGDQAYAVQEDSTFRAPTPGLHRLYVNLLLGEIGLDSAIIHVLKNGNTLGDAVVSFIGFGTDLVPVSGTAHLLLDAGDELKIMVEFTGAATADLKSANDGYAGSIIFEKL